MSILVKVIHFGLKRLTFERTEDSFKFIHFLKSWLIRPILRKSMTFWETDNSSAMDMLIHQSWHHLGIATCSCTGYGETVMDQPWPATKWVLSIPIVAQSRGLTFRWQYLPTTQLLPQNWHIGRRRTMPSSLHSLNPGTLTWMITPKPTLS